MCLAADVPLVESGSAGYLGQVTVIKKVFISLDYILLLSFKHQLASFFQGKRGL